MPHGRNEFKKRVMVGRAEVTTDDSITDMTHYTQIILSPPSGPQVKSLQTELLLPPVKSRENANAV